MNIHHKSGGDKTGIRTGIYKTPSTAGLHLHQFPELVFVLDGELDMIINSERYHGKRGDIFVIPPFAIHSCISCGDCQRFHFLFSSDIITDYISSDELYSTLDSYVFTPSETVFNYSLGLKVDTNYKFLQIDVHEIRRIKPMLYAVYEEFFRTVPIVKGKINSDILTKIFQYISTHYSEDITLSSLGKSLGYSPKYLSNCIAQLESMSLNKIINTIRISEAKRLLRSTSKSVISISVECGYENEQSFFRNFKIIEGITPNMYRKRMRRKTADV